VESKMSHIHSSHSSIGSNVDDGTAMLTSSDHSNYTVQICKQIGI
jgi:hypothetical protein